MVSGYWPFGILDRLGVGDKSLASNKLATSRTPPAIQNLFIYNTLFFCIFMHQVDQTMYQRFSQKIIPFN